MRNLSFTLCCLLVFMTTNCKAPDPNKGAKESTPAKQADLAPLKVWDEFRFGMSFDEAISASNGIRWDGESFQTCRNQIPVKGCSLTANPEQSSRAEFAGMELLPSLEFNEDGKLTSLNMDRIYRAGVTPDQCEAIHARLLDKLTLTYGQGKIEGSKNLFLKNSPAKNLYYRTKGSGGVIVYDNIRFRIATDSSNIVLLTVFVAGSEYSDSSCYTGFLVDGPKSLHRRPLK